MGWMSARKICVDFNPASSMSKRAVWRADEVYITFDARHESRQDRPPKATFTLTLYALAQELFDGWLGRVLNEDIDDHLWFFDRGWLGRVLNFHRLAWLVSCGERYGRNQQTLITGLPCAADSRQTIFDEFGTLEVGDSVTFSYDVCSPTVVILTVRTVGPPGSALKKKHCVGSNTTTSGLPSPLHASAVPPIDDSNAGPPAAGAGDAPPSRPQELDAVQLVAQLRRELMSRDALIAQLLGMVGSKGRDAAEGVADVPPEGVVDEEEVARAGPSEDPAPADSEVAEDGYQSTDSEAQGSPLYVELSVRLSPENKAGARAILAARKARHAACAAAAAPGTLDALFPALSRNVLRGDGFVFGPAARGVSLMLDRDSAGDSRGPKLASGAQFSDLDELLSLANYALGDAFLKRNREALSGVRLGWMVRQLFPTELLDAAAVAAYQEACEAAAVGPALCPGIVVARFSKKKRAVAAAKRGEWSFGSAFPALARFLSGQPQHAPNFSCLYYLQGRLEIARGEELHKGAPPTPLMRADCSGARTLQEIFVAAEAMAKQVVEGGAKRKRAEPKRS